MSNDSPDLTDLHARGELNLDRLEEAAKPMGDCNSWSLPVSLDQPTVPAFPVDALGGRLEEWVSAVAESTQTPSDLAGMLALAAVAASAHAYFRVHIGGDWTESLSMYIAVALPPGERKSAVLNQVVKPIEDWESETSRSLGAEIRETERRFEAADERVKAARRQSAKSKADARIQAERTLRVAEAELDRIVIPVLPRVLLDDATPEATGLVIESNGGRIAILTDEGGLFETLAGRYSEGIPNLDLFLKGYDGTNAWRRDRVNASRVIVQRPAITLGFAVQPDVVRGLAEKRGFRGRGLIGRFAYAIPASALGFRSSSPPPVPQDLSDWYKDAIRRLLELPGSRDEMGEIVPSMLELTPEAQERVYAASDTLEPRLGPGGDLAEMNDWAGKSIGRVVRIAALLHLLDSPNNANRPISASVIERALRIGEYLIEHARAAFDLFGLSEAMSDARALWCWVKRKRLEQFSHRVAWQNNKGRFKKVKRLYQALEELEERGYIVAVAAAPPGRKGGRPAGDDYRTNPLAFANHAEVVPKTPNTSVGATARPGFGGLGGASSGIERSESGSEGTGSGPSIAMRSVSPEADSRPHEKRGAEMYEFDPEADGPSFALDPHGH